MVRILTKDDFKTQVMGNQKLSIVQFKVDWSGSCQIMSPIYEELSIVYRDQAAFYTVDVEKDPELESQCGVTVVPTILFFKQGKLVDHITGLTPRNMMISKIENALLN